MDATTGAVRHEGSTSAPPFARNFALADAFVLIVSTAMLLALIVLPWMVARDGSSSYTALSLLTGASPETNVYIPDLIAIPFIATLVAMMLSAALVSGIIPKEKTPRFVLGIALAGILCLMYYPLIVIRPGISMDDTFREAGVAFRLCFYGSVLLITQGLISRRFRRVHLRRPTATDNTRMTYFQGLMQVVRDDMFGRNVIWFLMTIPAIIWLFVFKYLTMYGLIIAFQDYKPRRGIEGSDFTGLENFQFLFQTEQAIRATRNTLLLNILFIVVGMIFALFVATLLFEIYTSLATRYYQAALLLPNFISWVIVSYFVFAMLRTDDGLVNTLLNSLGVDPVRWYSSPEYWPVILLLANLWNSVGWGSLIYLSGMLAIDPQLFEAARIDGASKWQQFTGITFPLLLPLVVIQVLLSLGHIFNADFGLFFQVTRDQAALYPTTDVLDTFIYRSLTGSGAGIRLASAAQFYQSIVGFILVVVANYIVRRVSPPDNDLSLF